MAMRTKELIITKKQCDNLNISEDKYLINKAPLNYDYSNYTNFGQASMVISYLKKDFGTNHIEEKHPELSINNPHFLDKIIEIANNPFYISIDKKHGENRINILFPRENENRYYHLSVLLGMEENRVLSCRYQTIKNLDEKIASKGYKGFIKIKKK